MKSLILLWVLALACCEASAAETAFRYQGRLNDNGKPATGSYDLQLSVFATGPLGAGALASVVRTNVSVADGLFDTLVDFGDVFDGSTRLLEIAVRTNGSGAFVPLTPRQRITTVPYATYSTVAGSASVAGTASNALTVAVGAVNSASIVGAGLSASNIATNQVVKSVNGLRDQVVLMAGPGVSLSNNANTVVISATNSAVNVTGAVLNANQTFSGFNTFSAGLQIGSNANVSFGSQTRQMLNLWGNVYGIGVQSATMYFRADGNFANSGKFAWYRGGGHNDGIYSAGGGQTLMTLDPGGLNVSGGIGAGGGLWAGGDVTLPEVTSSVGGLPAHGFNGIGVYGTSNGRTFAGQTVEGPVVIGGFGGGLGVRSTLLGNTTEKLALQWDGSELKGDVRRGLSLSAYDGPLVTRGWDPFSSAAGADKSGLGRWGLFMDQGTMVLGCPDTDVGERGIELARYATDGTRTPLLRLSNIDGTAKFAGGIIGSNISCENLVVTNALRTGSARVSGILYLLNSVFMSGFEIMATNANATFRVVRADIIDATSDRNRKENFKTVDTEAILEKVVSLPISQWSFKNDGARHVGPMAQDFHAAFGLGGDEKSIATVDADGVALAAIQGLNKKVTEKEAEIQELKGRLEKLERLLRNQNRGGEE